MVISLEKPDDSEVSYFNSIISNAKRLALDSRIMIERNRPHSAIMLAIFAIEELGKALIVFWGVKNKGSKRTHPSHIEKQSAAFALLAAIEATTLTKARFAEINAAGGGLHEIGPLSSQFAFARSGFFDDYRMAATYADQNPKLPIAEIEGGFSVAIASEILQWFETVGESIATAGWAMELASTIYENDLGRL